MVGRKCLVKGKCGHPSILFAARIPTSGQVPCAASGIGGHFVRMRVSLLPPIVGFADPVKG